MALHWAWTFDVRGTAANYNDSGWESNGQNMAFALSRHPLVGYGGADYAAVVSNTRIVTPAFPKGALADGWVQWHYWVNNSSTTYDAVGLANSGGNLDLLWVQPTFGGVTTTLSIYSQEGGGKVLRGTTTGTMTPQTWNVIAVRFKPGGALGDIQISINGVVETIVAAGPVGATSNWDSIRFWAADTRFSQITVWDNPVDPVGTTVYWVPLLKPVSDLAIGSFTDQIGGVVNLFQAVDEAVPSVADYCTSVTTLDVVKFGVNTANINAAWAPDNIIGVSVVCHARGELALNSATPVVGKAASADVLGLTQLTDAQSAMINDVFLTQADGAAWTVAGLNAGHFGMRVN